MTYYPSLGMDIPEDFDEIFQQAYNEYLEVTLNNINGATTVAINNYIYVRSRELSIELPSVGDNGIAIDLDNFININLATLDTDILNALVSDYNTGGMVATAIPDITIEAIAYEMVVSLINANPTTYITLNTSPPLGSSNSEISANIGSILTAGIQLSTSDFYYY